ncbi:MAG: alpha/beta hydrolase [Burkholderiaceae bacterium]
MKIDNSLPERIVSPADHSAIESAAQRFETPCGDGAIIWHTWGTGIPVVLLHGGSGSWTHWVRNIRNLVANGYHVLIPDLPGFGDSANPPDGQDADVMPRWLEAGLASLIDNASCRLVGFSFGAMVATLWAASYPRRVSQLIMVGAPALSQKKMPRVGLRGWDHLPDGNERTAIHRHNLMALMLARTKSVDELSLALHAANLERDRLKRRRLAKTDIVVRTLPQVQCPVSGIWGARDAVYSDRIDTIEPGLSTAPGYRSLSFIPNSGHWTQYEDAELFDDLLCAELRQLPVS